MRHDELPGWDTYDDPDTYALLGTGNTVGVFQLESTGMQRLLRKLGPTCLDDIAAVLSLYRPGPMGANAHELFARRKPVSLHEELDGDLSPVLESTYGLIVFQEQVLQVLNIVCGWTYAEAELLFNAMRKKDHSKMEAAKPSYFAAGRDRGYTDQALGALWDTLVPFADYSFNKSHATGYAILSYQTAYLKAHFPREYMAALLSSVDDDVKRRPAYLAEVQRMGIQILPPDVNDSGGSWTPVENGLRYGLSAIKGVGGKAYEALVAKRPYKSLDDFLMRAPAKAMNGNVLGALAGSGALDSLCSARVTREALVAEIDDLKDQAMARREDRRRGQRRAIDVPLGPRVWHQKDLKQRCKLEKEYLGVTITTPQYRLTPTGPLPPSAWNWLAKLMKGSPGESEVFFEIRGQRVDVADKVYVSDTLKNVINMAGVDIQEVW